MRTMNQISMANYFTQVEPKLTEKENWVLEALEEIFPASAEQTAKHLGVYPNAISGRFTGLKKKGKIIKVYEQKNERGSTVAFWQPTETEQNAEDIY